MMKENIENAFETSPQNEIFPVRNCPTAPPLPTIMRSLSEPVMTSNQESMIEENFENAFVMSPQNEILPCHLTLHPSMSHQRPIPRSKLEAKQFKHKCQIPNVEMNVNASRGIDRGQEAKSVADSRETKNSS